MFENPHNQTTVDQTQPAKTDDVVDRTQALIDEVNRLLEKSPTSVPNPMATPATLAQAPLQSPPTVTPPAPQPVAAVTNPLPVAVQAIASATPITVEPTAPVAPVVTQAAAPAPVANEMQSFVSTLIGDGSLSQATGPIVPAAPPAELVTGMDSAAAPAHETTQQPVIQAPVVQAPVVQAPVVQAPVTQQAAPQEIAAEANSYSSMDLAALFGLPPEGTETEQNIETPIETNNSAPVEVDTVTEPRIPAEPEPTQFVSDAFAPATTESEAQDLQSAPTQPVESASFQTPQATANDYGFTQTEQTTDEVIAEDRDDIGEELGFEESLSAVDEMREFVEAEDIMHADDVVVEVEALNRRSEPSQKADPIEVSAEKPTDPQAESQSFTERYLAEFRDSIEDDLALPEAATPASDPAPEPPPQAPQANRPVETSTATDAAELSVESWMAKNFGNSEEDAEDGTAETDSTPQESAAAMNQTEPVIDESDSDGAAPPFAPEEVASNAAEATVIFESHPQLEALVGKRIHDLEVRIGQMFHSLSAQIESFSGVAAGPVEIEVPHVEATLVGDDEAVAPSELLDDDATVELQQRLRKTEIALSISSAKISQERARLEQMQADLERREARIESRLKNSSGGNGSNEDKKSGLMDRWKRHLG